MNCLIDYIGLRGCTAVIPGSGLYVNQLPGIDASLFEKIATADQVTGKRAWQDIQAFALQKLHTDITGIFNERYKIRSVARSVNVYGGLSSQTMAADSKYRGFGVDADSGIGSDYTRSNLMAISVDSLQLQLTSDIEEEIDFKIWDGDTLQILFELTINNEDYPLSDTYKITIPVNRVFNSKHLCFGVDFSDAESMETPLPVNANQTLHNCMSDWYGFDCCSYKCPGKVYGIETVDTTDLSTETELDHAAGLSGVVNLVCSYEPLVCSNKMQFKDAVWFLMGWSAMEYATKTTAFTRSNTVDLEKSKQDQDDLYRAYIDKLKIAVGGINLDTADLCLECGDSIRKEYVHA